MIVAPKDGYIIYGRSQLVNPFRGHPPKIGIAQSGQIVSSVEVRCDPYEVCPKHAFYGETGCQVRGQVIAPRLRICRLDKSFACCLSVVLSVKTHLQEVTSKAEAGRTFRVITTIGLTSPSIKKCSGVRFELKTHRGKTLVSQLFERPSGA